MKKILIKRSDGGVSVMATREDADPDVEIQKWQESYPEAQAVGHCEIKDADIPTDRKFRDAWVHDGDAVKHDMEKCRQIHLGRIRRVRDAKLLELDKATMRYMNDETKKQEIESEKQVLRDIPATLSTAIASATTVEELKAIQSPELGNV